MRPISIAFLLAAAAATGCGGSDQTSDPTTISVTEPATTSTAAATTTTAQMTGEAADEGSGGASTPKPDPGSGTGAQSPAEAVSAVLTDDGTAEQACGSYVTEAFIESSYGGEQNCIAARNDEALARAVVFGPGADDQSTHLVVVPKGGPYDGSRVEVELVTDGDGFRVDALKAHVPAGP